MKYISICSGIEAASTAWHSLGWEPLAFAEIEKFPSAVLAHHWPDVPNLGDMTKHHAWPTTLQPDLIVGGTPCQAFSVAGLRAGLTDPRGNLTLTFLSIIEQYRPRWVVWENVPGVLSDKTRAFGSLLGGLGQLGYGFAYRVLDAQYFGVAQRRRRVFVVACLGDWQRAAAVLFESHSLQRHSPPSREAPKGTSQGFETGPCGNRFIDTAPTLDTKCKDGPIRNQLGAVMQFSNEIADCLQTTCGDYSRADGFNMVAFSCKDHGADAGEISPTLRSMSASESHANGGGQVAIAASSVMFERRFVRTSGGHPQEELSHCLRADQNTGDGAPCVAFRACGQEGFTPSGIAPCLSATDGGGTVPTINTNHIVRRLTPTECARLQGFPDNHCNIPWNGWRAMDADETPEQCIADGLEVRQNKKTGKWRVKDVDGPKYKAYGNSMAVPVMRWIGQRINLFH